MVPTDLSLGLVLSTTVYMLGASTDPLDSFMKKNELK